jgi:hypothetical protein
MHAKTVTVVAPITLLDTLHNPEMERAAEAARTTDHESQ